ncbi:MAG: aspartate-semialdehyde dehydrogenase [bacterium]
MQKLDKKIRVGVLGATGMVGQKLISLLDDHPWFEVSVVAASRNSAGKKLGSLTLYSVEDDIDAISKKCSFVFCAINAQGEKKEFIKRIEEAYASLGMPVVSNNSAHRWTSDVPMIIPEVNPEHLEMISVQQKNRGWTSGFIVTKPNCSIQSYVPLLNAWINFVPQRIIVSTYQAISGAGKTFESWPEMVDNVIPFIGGEEEKSEQEPSKVMGQIKKGKFILNKKLKISANCIRVPVSDGHMAAINVKFGKKTSVAKLIKALQDFKNPLADLGLPSAPQPFITYFEEENRPQTKLDRGLHGGMGISVGRIREDSVFDFKCVALSHNTIRGAAGGSILTAELLVKKGYIK